MTKKGPFDFLLPSTQKEDDDGYRKIIQSSKTTRLLHPVSDEVSKLFIFGELIKASQSEVCLYMHNESLLTEQKRNGERYPSVYEILSDNPKFGIRVVCASDKIAQHPYLKQLEADNKIQLCVNENLPPKIGDFVLVDNKHQGCESYEINKTLYITNISQNPNKCETEKNSHQIWKDLFETAWKTGHQHIRS